MKTANVRDLRNSYSRILRWISAGEEVLIQRRGVVIARLSPANPKSAAIVNWADSPEVTRDRSRETLLTADETASLVADAGGRW